MTKGCFIGIDQGSSSTKAVAVALDGTLIAQVRRELPPPFREDLRVEQDAGAIFDSLRQAVDEAAEQAAASGQPVLGIGLACQRSSCLAWNERTGEPLAPVLSWRDARGAPLIDALSGSAPLVVERTGLPLTPYYSASKFRWLRDNVPAADAPEAVMGTLSSFLCRCLTGAAPAVIDHTNAARTQLMNIRSLAWDPELLRLFGLDGLRLPAPVPTVHAYGTVATPAGPAPLLACLGDQQAAMLGLGISGEGDGGINYGTGGFLMANTGTTLRPAPGLMASVHYSTDREVRYLLEGSVNAVGDALEWLRTTARIFERYDEVDDLCWKAAADVVAFIGLNGTGAPHWEQRISSALHGPAAGSGPADVVRAAIECIVFFLRDIAEAARAAGIDPGHYTASGGLSSLTYLIQAQADILGKDILVSSEQEATAKGAAFLAGLGRGAWTRDDLRRLAVPSDRVTAGNNAGLEHRYRRWKELHRAVRMLDGIS